MTDLNLSAGLVPVKTKNNILSVVEIKQYLAAMPLKFPIIPLDFQAFNSHK